MTSADEKIEAVKTWFQEHQWDSWVDWDAFMELGAILKQETEPEPEAEEDYPMSEHVRQSPRRFVWSEPVRQPEPYQERRKLDPMPFVVLRDGVEERVSYSDPNRIYGRFAPAANYEQDRGKYQTTFMRQSVIR